MVRWSRSTLLRAIGQGLVVGFPKNLHALYVEQLEGTDGAMSVINTVMQADKEVLSWRQKASLLQVPTTASSWAASLPHQQFSQQMFPSCLKPESLLRTQ